MPFAEEAEEYCAIAISNAGKRGDPLPADLLSWVSVYLGEDVFGVGLRGGSPRPYVRGSLRLDSAEMGAFLANAEAWSAAALTNKWRAACLQAAFGYFCSGIAMGLDLTPVTEGIFATGAETLANAADFHPEAHRKLGQQQGPKSLLQRIADDGLREHLLADLHLLTMLRNKCGAHFGLHQARERQALCRELRDHLVRRGCSRGFADLSFEEERLLDDLQVNAHSLYCMALTVVRACFHALVGGAELLRFAERDLPV